MASPNNWNFQLPSEYLDLKYWDRPKRSARGNDDPKEIFCAVGEALSSWENLEQSLSRVFSTLMEGRTRTASRVYGAVIAAQTRYELLKFAAEGFFDLRQDPEKFAKTLDTLLANYSRAGGRRNDIAHGIVTNLAHDPAKQLKCFLIAPVYQSRRTKGVPLILEGIYTWKLGGMGSKIHAETALRRTSYAYTAAQISEFGQKFLRLAGDLAWFSLPLGDYARGTKPPM